MRTGFVIAGGCLLLIGLLWMGQGGNLIGGSFMTGQSIWLEIGIGAALLGAALIWWGTFGHRRLR